MTAVKRAPILALFALVFLTTMSGTIASSDGHTMMQLTRAIVDRGALDVEGGNTYAGVGGRQYPKAGLGQALLGVPLYAAANLAANALPPLARHREPFVRFVMQLAGPLVSAGLCAVFFGLLVELGLGTAAAFLGTLLLGLATPVWVYSKSYLTEPWTALLLLAAFLELWRFRRGGEPRHAFLAGLAAGYAVAIKAAMALPVLGLALYFLYVLLRERRSAAAFFAALLPLAACCALVLFYNHARFGRWAESGYGYEQTPAGYSTPVYVGLYGQLLSAGKGLFFFAPPLLLLLPAWRPFYRRFRAEAWTLLAVTLPSLLLNSSFRAWAGDGSWGPRYLVPFVPLLMIPVCVWAAGPRGPRRWAGLMLVLGMLVQWGGVAVYYGSYLREMGQYPYTRQFEDPRFLEDVHWVPNFSPIVGHWRMFRRDLDEHLKGQWPQVTLRDESPGAAPAASVSPALPGEPSGALAAGRIPLSAEDQGRMLHALDFWFLYPVYLGLIGPGVLVLPGLLLLAVLGAFLRCWREYVAAPARPR